MRSARAEAGAGVLLALILALTTACSGTYTASPPKVARSAAPESAAAETLLRLVHAWRSGDEDAAQDLGSVSAVSTQLTDVAENVGRVRIGALDLRYLAATGRTGSDGSWSARVEVAWQIRGFDKSAARREITVGFAKDGASITALGGEGSALPIWLAGPVRVSRTSDSLVFGQINARRLSRIAAQAGRAVHEAESVLGGSRRVVVEVPRSTAGLHRALDAEEPSYSRVAAVTAPVDGSIIESTPVHIFLNPAVYHRLDPVSAQVVMTHEVVHAVTGAATASGPPLWLIEGFADYVALRDVDLPLSRTAAQISRRVRTGGVPAGLPADIDLRTTADHLGAEYEAAWLVCVVLAEHGGEESLRAFYGSVLAGTDLARAIVKNFGWSLSDLTAAWQRRLEVIAGMSQ